MRHYQILLFLSLCFIALPFAVKSQTFQAYYQKNFKWDGAKFTEDSPSSTSTSFAFNKDKLTIDNNPFTITSRVSNSSGDYVAATLNSDSSIRITIAIELQTDSRGRKFKTIAVDRAKSYKMIYYIK